MLSIVAQAPAAGAAGSAFVPQLLHLGTQLIKASRDGCHVGQRGVAPLFSGLSLLFSGVGAFASGLSLFHGSLALPFGRVGAFGLPLFRGRFAPPFGGDVADYCSQCEYQGGLW